MAVESILRWPPFAIEHPLLATQLGQATNKPVYTTEIDLSDLDRAAISQLVENFLATHHIKNPICDVEQLWKLVKGVDETGLQWDGSTCLMLLICSVSVLSAIDKDKDRGYSKRPDRLARAERYFQASQRRIGMVYHEHSLLAVQCSFLSAVYLMTTFRILAAWKAFAQAGTQFMAWLAVRGRIEPHHFGIGPGLVSENHTPAGSPMQHVEESLYWSCLKSELELRTELGYPGSPLNEMHYPHLYPSPPGPVSMTASFVRPNSDVERDRNLLEKGWFFYLGEIALRRILNEALSARYGADSWYYTTEWWTTTSQGNLRAYVEEFKLRLDTWYDTVPEPMHFPQSPGKPAGDQLRGILRAHLIDVLDVVYFPAVRAVVFEEISELGPYVLATARHALENAAKRLVISREGYWHRHQGTWLMIRTCSRSSLQLLAVAARARREPCLEELLPAGWKHLVAEVVEMIAYWEDESPDLGILLERLKMLM
ncbi:uncharacterized protein DNG_10061 [Cephalotrichum gorgonifer]|uniref:Transcription factor domain-containing protein n=1 Tax=Cephalotrichum gorgonifer TaxID=2041049 RepID=A0AAE8T0H9_9PEZI|nr:uncharacterized protein DNG_10061 [Cephalotrichum gorgonifer]